jgi:hypothetical protein
MFCMAGMEPMVGHSARIGVCSKGPVPPICASWGGWRDWERLRSRYGGSGYSEEIVSNYHSAVKVKMSGK